MDEDVLTDDYGIHGICEICGRPTLVNVYGVCEECMEEDVADLYEEEEMDEYDEWMDEL